MGWGLMSTSDGSQALVIEADRLDSLIKALRKSGYKTIGPKARDGAVVLEEISGADELPIGLVDDQQPGAYRLSKAKKPAYFDFTHGSQTWKRYLFLPKEKLWTAQKTDNGFVVEAEVDAPKYAFIGVRACELAAIQIQDKVFVDGEHTATGYKARRDKALIVALNCRRAGGTCFCTSMNTGPKVKDGYDLALTELTKKDSHVFLVEAGSDQGEKILARLDGRLQLLLGEIDALACRRTLFGSQFAQPLQQIRETAFLTQVLDTQVIERPLIGGLFDGL